MLGSEALASPETYEAKSPFYKATIIALLSNKLLSV